MEFINYKQEYFEEYFSMSKTLFSGYSGKELRKDLDHAIRSEKHEAFFAKDNGIIPGFVNVSIRTDYVEGATGSPVGYIEALFVKPEFRKKGIAGKLFEVAEEWALKKGCTQMGSDTWVSNKGSRAFHLRMGFKEDDILVHFIKDIHSTRDQ
jgi:aminoglycoside 6'-N-acetyltransferase I